VVCEIQEHKEEKVLDSRVKEESSPNYIPCLPADSHASRGVVYELGFGASEFSQR